MTNWRGNLDGLPLDQDPLLPLLPELASPPKGAGGGGGLRSTWPPLAPSATVLWSTCLLLVAFCLLQTVSAQGACCVLS